MLAGIFGARVRAGRDSSFLPPVFAGRGEVADGAVPELMPREAGRAALRRNA